MVLDSTAAGWKGAMVATALQSDSLKLVSVSVSADTLRFGIPVNGLTVYAEGLVAGSKFSGQLWVENSNAGTIQLTRKATPDSDKKPPTR